MRYLLAFAIWSGLWVPVSMLFQSHPHFPSALISPVFGVVCVLHPGALDRHSNLFAEVTLPFLVYWLVLVGALAGCLAHAAYRHRQQRAARLR